MPSLNGLRVLVTGGAGMIGSHLVDLLLDTGAADVIVLDDLSRGRVANLAGAIARGGVTLMEGDIRDRALVASAFEGIDIAYHLAAVRLTQCQEQPRLSIEVMADGTFNVIEAATAARVRRLVVASSASVYGAADDFPTSEGHHANNDRTFYGAAKSYSEGLLRSFREASGLDYVALRPFNVYGPRMDTLGAYTEVLVRWMDRIAAGKPPIVFGEGSRSMDFVYVGDVARAFLLAATGGVPGEIYNVATEVETSLKALAEALLRAMDSPLGIDFAPPRSGSPVPRRLGATRKARDELGFEAETSLDEGLRQLVAWWRNAGRPAS
ncbi:MAG: NAD-dependent epimerase/dehydratase family protein [Bauldia sp.]